MFISRRLLTVERPSNTSPPWMLVARSLLKRVSDLCSKVLVLISSVVSLALVCSQSTTKFNYSCSARPSRVDLDKCTMQSLA